MPFPIPPNIFKELIASPSASFCEKFMRSLKLPYYIWKNFSWAVGEDGNLTKEGATLFCNLNCKGTTGSSPNAPVIAASDGAFVDKVRITWTGVAGATSYEVFRNNTNSTATAVSLGATASLSFDDTNVTVGTSYFYWVRAKIGSNNGPFSAVDTGFAANALDAVSDLDATKGFSDISLPIVALVWTPVSGATAWDIYRATSDSFAAATKIDSDRVPFDSTESLSTGPNPPFVDNGGELVYYDQPPDKWTTYYYWVVAKAQNAIGLESNSASGWANGFGDGVAAAFGAVHEGNPIVVNGETARVVLFGGGGNGAGSSGSRGGGGAGCGAVCYGNMEITGATPTFRVTSDVIQPRSTSQQIGSIVPWAQLDFAPDGSTWSEKARAEQGDIEPVYNSTGNGTGGDGGDGTTTGLTDAGVKPGRAGKPANGNKGGRSGYHFGGLAHPGANYNFTTGQGVPYNGDGPAGSGAYAHTAGGSLQSGGLGSKGYAIIWSR